MSNEKSRPSVPLIIALLLVAGAVFLPIFVALGFLLFEPPLGDPPDQHLLRFDGAVELVEAVLSWEVAGAAAAWIFRKEIAQLIHRVASGDGSRAGDPPARVR